MMATITVIDSEGKVDFNFPLADKPVRLGKGENCNKVLPELPVSGPQLEIEYDAGQNRLLARRLSSDCEVWIGDQRIGDGSAIWPAEIELRIGTYRLTNDLGSANRPISAQDGFSVEIKSGEDYLSLTPGAPMNCSLRITNQSARNVTGALHVEINGQPIKWCAGAGNMGRAFTPYEERTFTLTFTAPTDSTVKAGTYQVDVTAIPDSKVEKFRSGGDSLTAIVERFPQHSQRIDRLLRFNPLFGFIFRSARFNFEVNNTGNCDDTYSLATAPNSDSDERTEYQFTDTGAPKTSLEAAVGNVNAAQLQVQRPLLWFPLWKGHRFNASIANSANQIVRFTQLSVVWLILVTGLLGWLGWHAGMILLKPKFEIEKTGFKPDKIEAGDKVEVFWKALRASTVDIYQVMGNQQQPKSLLQNRAGSSEGEEIGPFEKDIELLFIARNFWGEDRTTLPIPVGFQEATIRFITENPKRLQLTETGSVDMSVEFEVVKGKFISEVTINGDPVTEVAGKYSYPISPEGSKQYVVEVRYSNSQKVTKDTFRVIVDKPTPTPSATPTPSPTPLTDCSLSAIWPATVVERMERRRNATNIHRGDMIDLKWEVRDADRIKITQQTDGNGPTTFLESTRVADKQEVIPPLKRSTTFTLIAFKNGQQTICNSVRIVVNCKDRSLTNLLGEWKPCR